MVSLDTLLRESKSFKKLAVVGVPCLIQSIRKAQNLGLAKNIKYCLGLFCGLNMERSFVDFMIHKFNIKKTNIKAINYRKGPWPGGFSIKLKNNKEKFLSKSSYAFFHSIFAPERCIYCLDHSNELADISVGDAWFMQDKKGWSSVIVRTKKGKQIFKNSHLTYKKIPLNMISDSQKFLIKFKKSAPERIKKLRIKPRYKTNTKIEKQGLKQKMFCVIYKFRKPIIFFVGFIPISFTKFISNIIVKGLRKKKKIKP